MNFLNKQYLLTLVAALALAGCAGGMEQANDEAADMQQEAEEVAEQAEEGTQEEAAGDAPVVAALGEWYLRMEQTTFEAGKVQLLVINEGRFPHVLEIEGVPGAITSRLASGESEMLEVDLSPGTYTVVCPIPGHRERGQVALIVVE